ncbi:TetR family transcriptional regulator [Novosphingobium marinum]|uniref:AcrR family transcriptional regulator n=1 Tax=Novosphingobium marinum TaxID=1514948 RepID=A0A7Z0BWY9_9SPHN|nr:TetR/AcrR family transcriptional regulator [Novosphingobium marinum]NYH96802.1 AcrR family transcriptional regulator [Novosphingobium marinum]GGC40123.1 TetR family transcriptional regulator [Novosphingobium marinum]
MSNDRTVETAGPDKIPRTARGRETLRKLLDAAAEEFGEKGFHDGSISGITRRAGTALGSFYTYFDSKDEIFRALVKDMSERVKTSAGKAQVDGLTSLERERAALAGFMEFARAHKEIYRIIDEAEFVDPESYRKHYETTARRIRERLEYGAAKGDLKPGLGEAHAWAIMGMNVFLGLRYAVWASDEDTDRVADIAAAILAEGIGPKG